MNKLYNEVYTDTRSQDFENKRYTQLLNSSEIQRLEANREETIRDSLIDVFDQAIEMLSIDNENQEISHRL